MFRSALWHSLKFRITAAVLLGFVVALWALGQIAKQTLRHELEHLLSLQQQSVAASVAMKIGHDLHTLLDNLDVVSQRIDKPLLADPPRLRKMLAELPVLQRFFEDGILVLSPNGNTLAIIHAAAGADDFSRKALQDLPFHEGRVIGRPGFVRNAKRPTLPLGVAIVDRQGEVIGQLVGLAPLGEKGFLHKTAGMPLGKSGVFMVMSPRDNVFVAATDPNRLMNPLPPAGVNRMHDRYMQGYEGSGVATNSRGVEELTAAQRIPLTDWFVVAALPTSEAFAPLHETERQITLAALLLTLLASLAFWWFLHRQLAPLGLAASEALRLQQHTRLSPPRVKDEIATLVHAFNLLLDTLETQTELLKAEERREEEQRQREALQDTLSYITAQVPGVIFQMRRAGEGRMEVNFISEGVREFYGVTPEQVYQKPSSIFSLARLVDPPAFTASLNEAVNQQRAWLLEYSVRLADGSVRWHLSTAHIERQPNGCLQWNGFIADITERKKQEARLHALLKENESILRNALVGIVHLRNRVIVSCNRRLERLFGYEPGEMLGLSTERLYASRNIFIDIGERAYSALARNNEYSEEVLFKRKDGTIFWGALTGCAVDPTNPMADSTWIFADISQRRQAEQELHRLLQAVEQSPVSIVITNVDGLIEYVNPRFTQVTGYSRNEVIGQNPRILQSGSTPQATYQTLWNTLLAGHMWQGTLQNRRRNGELFWEFASIAPIIDPLGKITGFIAVKEDITERKHIEEQLVRHQQHLEELVDQRTADLKEALLAARQADQAKDAFLATISHELRTPLSAVIGMAEMARRICHDAQQQGYLDKITAAGKTLSLLINDLLDLSKIVAGRLEFENITFSLRGLIERSQSVMSGKATEKGLLLREHIDDDVPDILVGDPLRIEQIFLNLLSNAVKFTPSGHIDIHVGIFAQEEREKGKVGEGTGSCGREERIGLRIEVADSGIGMSADEMAHLFVPFSQADASMSRRYGGSGLGLAICKQLVTMMDGEIEVQSRKGEGSTFIVELWLTVGHPENLPQQQRLLSEDELPKRYHNVRLLVVEDQELNQEIVEAMLAVVGITPTVASNGREALDILAATAPDAFDLVLMDVQMPLMDGLTATRELRRWPGFAALPVIAMTAHTMRHEVENCRQCGMNDHIGKPFDSPAFYRTIARWLPREKQQAALPLERVLSARQDGGANEKPSVDAASDQPPPSDNLPRIAGIDIETGLARFTGKPARYRHWLTAFITEGPAAATQIRLALASEERDSARKAAHALKGRAGMLGMNALHGIAAQLETALQHGEPASELMADLQSCVAELCYNLQQALGETPPHDATLPAPGFTPHAATGTTPPETLPDCITELLQMLARNDGASQAAIARCQKTLHGTPWEIALQQAQERVRNFDFSGAKQLLLKPREESIDASPSRLVQLPPVTTRTTEP